MATMSIAGNAGRKPYVATTRIKGKIRVGDRTSDLHEVARFHGFESSEGTEGSVVFEHKTDDPKVFHEAVRAFRKDVSSIEIMAPPRLV